MTPSEALVMRAFAAIHQAHQAACINASTRRGDRPTVSYPPNYGGWRKRVCGDIAPRMGLTPERVEQILGAEGR